MLCCISRKPVAAPKFRHHSSLIPAPTNYPHELSYLPPESESKCEINLPSCENIKLDDEELGDELSILLPCSICARTFKPLSLEKHMKICERAAIKRKPFDSSKQRILGTELENFLPHQTKKLNYHEEKISSKASWKKTHDEFLRTIRAARVDSMDMIPNRQTVTTNVSSGAPMRTNEKGQCPTCYRQFGIKAYERHVAWCKERITRAPSSPATNVAKERLDARINYRAPSLKNRRMTNREKYAPGNFNMTNTTNKNNTSPPSVGMKGIKDNASSINGNKHVDNPIITSSAIAERRNGQGRGDGATTSGPVKSRLCDRSIKRVDNRYLTLPPIFSCPSQSQNNQYLPYNLSNRQNRENDTTSTAMLSQSHSKTRKLKVRGSRKLRHHKNIVITQSQGNPKVNDIAVNDNEIGMTVNPCFNCNEKELITWKQICDDKLKVQFEDGNSETDVFIALNNIEWISSIEKLDRTYLINESVDLEMDNNTRVIYRSSIDPNLKISMDEGMNDDDVFPPTTSTEFGIDVTSTSTPVLLLDMNNSPRDDKFLINDDDKVENKLTIETNDDTKQQGGDTYVIEQIIVSSDLNNTQKIVEEVAEVYDNSLENSMNSNGNNEMKMNSSSGPSIESVTIPQISDGILLINQIIPINNFCLKSDTELSVTLSRDFTRDSLDSCGSNEILMKKRLRKKMNLLRDSTDFSISSIETNNKRVNLRFASDPHLEMNAAIDDVNIGNQRNTDKYSMFPDILNSQQVQKPQILPDRKMPYWKQMMKTSRKKFINNLNLLKNPKINSNSFPPLVPVDRRNDDQNDSSRLSWINYVRRHPDFNLVLTGRIGMCQDYDPFLIAERQLNELLSDTCSDQSCPDSPSSQYKKSKSPHYPLSQSSAFVKYPNPLSSDTPTEKRASLVAPPSEFDDSSTGFSSDSTETNSITRELFTEIESSNCRRENMTNKNKDNQPILGRRVIIEKSKALGCTNNNFNMNIQTQNASKSKTHEAMGEIISDNAVRSQVTRLNSVRAVSASKKDEQNDSCLSHKMNSRSSSGSRFYNRNNNYGQNSGSNLSLSSIVSSENEIKRSNFGLDDFTNSFDDDSISYPSLKSFLKNDSLSTSSPIQVNRKDNGQVNDDNLSSPDSYKRQDHSKISVDSAYSSLNRKYSNHGLNNTDMANTRNEITTSRHNTNNELTSTIKLKMSKFCHECGTKFPNTAKFCCECGVQRLTL